MTSDSKDWEQDYAERGKVIRDRLALTLYRCWEEAEGNFFKTWNLVQGKRGATEHPFCLLLYAQYTDLQLANQVILEKELEFDTLELEAMADLSDDPKRNANAAWLLTRALDLTSSLYCVMLETETEAPRSVPLGFPISDDLWQQTFALLAEMAQAILVIANLSNNLLFETRHLKDVGLDGRILVLSDMKLHSYDSSKPDKVGESWPIMEIEEAVRHAASQPRRDVLNDTLSALHG